MVIRVDGEILLPELGSRLCQRERDEAFFFVSLIFLQSHKANSVELLMLTCTYGGGYFAQTLYRTCTSTNVYYIFKTECISYNVDG